MEVDEAVAGHGKDAVEDADRKLSSFWRAAFRMSRAQILAVDVIDARPRRRVVAPTSPPAKVSGRCR